MANDDPDQNPVGQLSSAGSTDRGSARDAERSSTGRSSLTRSISKATNCLGQALLPNQPARPRIGILPRRQNRPRARPDLVLPRTCETKMLQDLGAPVPE